MFVRSSSDLTEISVSRSPSGNWHFRSTAYPQNSSNFTISSEKKRKHTNQFHFLLRKIEIGENFERTWEWDGINNGEDSGETADVTELPVDRARKYSTAVTTQKLETAFALLRRHHSQGFWSFWVYYFGEEEIWEWCWILKPRFVWVEGSLFIRRNWRHLGTPKRNIRSSQGVFWTILWSNILVFVSFHCIKQ